MAIPQACRRRCAVLSISLAVPCGERFCTTTSQGATVLLLVVHHIILDADSKEILLHDLAAAFNDPDGALPTASYDFFDLASHERELLAAEQPALERFWSKTLAGAELTPELPPACIACPPGEEERRCEARLTLSPALSFSIRACAAELGTTPFQLYLTAYLTLLRTYTASDDLVVGSTLSLRDTPAAQNVVGYLLSPVPLRVRLAGSFSFREAVEEVSRRWQEVRAHGRLPMHVMVQSALGGQRSGLGSPFQVFFSLINHVKLDLSIDGAPLLPVDLPPRASSSSSSSWPRSARRTHRSSSRLSAACLTPTWQNVCSSNLSGCCALRPRKSTCPYRNSLS